MLILSAYHQTVTLNRQSINLSVWQCHQNPSAPSDQMALVKLLNPNFLFFEIKMNIITFLNGPKD